MSTTPTPDLDRLLRWEDSGGTWRVAARRTVARAQPSGDEQSGDQRDGEEVTLSLMTCDGGEEMDVLTSSEPAVLEHVRSVGPTAR